MVDRRLRHGVLQPCVVTLEVLQALRLINPQAAAALALVDVRVVRHPELLRRLRYCLANAKQHIRVAQLVDDLFRHIPLFR
jgi:hypothetical protein